MIKISIIMPTYNRCDFLHESVPTISNQKVLPGFDYELLIVDNNSTDQTKAVTEQYINLNPKIKYLHEPKQGTQHALNRGIQSSTGDLIAVLGDDCLIEDDYLVKLYELNKKHGDHVGMFGGKILPSWIDKPMPKWIDHRLTGCMGLLDYGERPFLIDEKKLFYGANFIIKKSILDQFGSYDPTLTYTQDVELCLRLLNNHINGLYSPTLKVFHRIGSECFHPRFFYEWFEKKGRYDKDILVYPIKKRHIKGVPFWVYKSIALNALRSLICLSKANRVYYRSISFYHIGMMKARIEGVQQKN